MAHSLIYLKKKYPGRMNKDNFVFFIHCPSNSLNNGGVETLHQLGHHLKKNNFKVFISFFPNIDIELIPEKLINYNLNYKKFEDEKNFIHVIPEVETIRTKLIKKGKCVIYWLSVDSYYRRNLDKSFWKNWNYYRKTINKRIFFFNLKKHYHLANSHYANKFLEKKKINSEILKGYISKYFDGEFDILKKKNIILYNPVKDQNHYKKIMQLLPHYEFKALSQMTDLEIKDNYNCSKIFMDLGTHPGRERMPREASMMGCILIVANRGSASNNYDVPIDKLYKMNLNEKNIYDKISDLIENIFTNYESHLRNFETYKDKISYKSDSKVFDETVREYFQEITKKLS
jgi:hypothetical protein